MIAVNGTIGKRKTTMNTLTVQKIFECFEKNAPTPVTELQYQSPFELLIAVMLSAQMTDKGVNKATATLFPIANTPADFLKLGSDKLEFYLKSINYFRAKTRHILKTCQILITQHNSHVPDTREKLEGLPGVGRKTANVILSVLFDQAVIAVDTHIFRVANRTGLAKGKTPRIIEDLLLKKIPEKYLKKAHHWLVLHGRYTCTARQPHCKTCIIQPYCEFKDKNI